MSGLAFSPLRFAVDRDALVARLRAVLPDGALIIDAEALRPYECDGLTAYRQMPLLVALPEDEGQAQAVLRVCHELGVPVVPRGAATGLSGGVLPHPDGVVVSLARLKRIVSIDPQSRTAVVQPGVRNLAVSAAAAPYGLYYAPDPSSQIACTIGGNIAENSGGVHCLKYGLTVHNVLRVRGLCFGGNSGGNSGSDSAGDSARDSARDSAGGVELVEFGSAAPDSPGYDLLALVNGSEGLLTLVTEATLRLTPKPELAQVALASFDDVTRAGDAVAAIIAAGILPAGLEMMDKKATHAVEPFVNAGYDMDAEALLLCESDGTPAEVAEEMARMQAVLAASGASAIRVSQNEAERLKFWAGRKAAFPAVGRITPDYLCMDGTIPRHSVGRMLAAIAEMERRYGLRCANVFHAGDGNLHPLIMYDANRPGEQELAQAFGAEILELSVAFGGTITGEHGVGVEKITQMCAQFTPDELALFERVKRAFDPAGLLNPGKAVPTPARCREYRLARAATGTAPPSAAGAPAE